MQTPMQPLVGLIMGSASDWETLQHAAQTPAAKHRTDYAQGSASSPTLLR